MFKLVVVSGNSMEPTLKRGQKLLVLKTKDVKAGDIIVLKHPLRNIKIVKRLVEKSGEKLAVAGDNQTQSTDSKDYGPVRLQNLIGKVVWKF